MVLTTQHLMLIDILTDRILTASTSLSKVNSMSEEEVKAEIVKYEDLKSKEEARLNSH